MTKRVEFYFDVGSPASYLAFTQIPGIAAETGAELVYRPMLLGGVFQATGNASPAHVPAKGRWVNEDLAEHARRYGIPLRMNPYFPINTLLLMRGAVAMQLKHPDRFLAYVDAIFQGIWVAGLNLGDASVVAGVLHEAGFDAATVMAELTDPDVKAALKATTEQAVARGVFGAPSFFVGDRLFFGQDRLAFVRDALAASLAS